MVYECEYVCIQGVAVRDTLLERRHLTFRQPIKKPISRLIY